MGALADWQIKRDVKIEPFADTQQAKGTISFGCGSNGYDLRVGYKFRVFTPTYSAVIDPKNFDERALVDFDLTPYRHNELAYEGGHAGGGKFTHTKEYWYQCPHCHADQRSPELCGKLCPHQPNHVLIPPNSFALAESLERITMPRDVVGIVQGKSTYARCGLNVNCTPVEPEWSGILTIELANTAPLPLKVYAGEGICQVIFIRSDGLREYAYQHHLNHLIMRHGDHAQGTEANLDWLKKVGSCTTSYADKKGRYQDQSGLQLPFVDKGEK